MTIAENVFEFLVPNDADGPCFAPAGMFELFTAEVPAGLKLCLESGIRASGRALWRTPGIACWGYPQMVDDPDYIRAFLELEFDAVAVFQRNSPPILVKRSDVSDLQLRAVLVSAEPLTPTR